MCWWNVCSFSKGAAYTGVFKCPPQIKISRIEINTLLGYTSKSKCMQTYLIQNIFPCFGEAELIPEQCPHILDMWWYSEGLLERKTQYNNNTNSGIYYSLEWCSQYTDNTASLSWTILLIGATSLALQWWLGSVMALPAVSSVLDGSAAAGSFRLFF
jgi:hypothetical protein